MDVAVTRPVFKTLTYAVPPSLEAQAAVGKRVFVPVRGRKVTGYILDVLGKTEQASIKEILDVLDAEPLFPPTLTPFFRWVADYYLYPIGEVIKGALPAGINATQQYVYAITGRGRARLKKMGPGDDQAILAVLDQTAEATKTILNHTLGHMVPAKTLNRLKKDGLIVEESRFKSGRVRPRKERYVKIVRPVVKKKRSQSRRTILSLVEENGEISLSALKKEISTAGPLVKKMAQAGDVTVQEKEVYRDPFGDPIEADPILPVLSKDQATVVSEIVAFLEKGFKTCLLHGITGSGKTEVYMRAADAVLKKNGQVLVLVPEIGLISQTERRFRARFGDCVALLHSGLSHGERLDQWMRIVRGEATIAIGARSAIFAPFRRLGLVVVDEEHDDSYKQESRLRYHARDLAVVRAKLDGAVALLGSATPSLQSYFNMTTGRYHGLRLARRIEDVPLPTVDVVDLRATEGYRRAKPFITPELKEAMEDTLARGEQTLLFLNRRGFASCPTCTSCGTAMRCKNCDITMTLHQGVHAFRCHYCGYSLPETTPCSICGNTRIKHLGLGTEKVESKIQTLFPDARVARMDRDTTARKGALVKILKDLRRGAIDILVGTQMVAKGHHYPNITLVGILCADLSLNFPDFRSGERTFQLLAQVSGRAGRGERPGRVILQSFNPQHFSIDTAASQAYGTFYREEISFRKALGYPPYSRLVQILVTGKDKKKTGQCAMLLGTLCRQLQRQDRTLGKEVQALGPVPAPLARIQKKYRWHFFLRGKNARTLHDLAKTLWARTEPECRAAGAVITINVDPVDML